MNSKCLIETVCRSTNILNRVLLYEPQTILPYGQATDDFRVNEPNVKTALSIMNRKSIIKPLEVNHQTIGSFYAKWSQEHPLMKIKIKIPCLLNKRAKLQFETFNLCYYLKLPPFELKKRPSLLNLTSF